MSKVVTICREEIIQQIKLSCQVPSVVEGILTRKIIARAVEEQGIKVEPEELQQAADNLRMLSNLRSTDATWLWLQKHNLSLDEFEELVEVSVASSKLAQHLFADKVEPFFVEHQLEYNQVVMYEVVLDEEDLALELFYALQEGEINFHEVARQYIQDPELRRRGGYLGALPRTKLKPEISAAVFAVEPPQIIKPVLTSSGAHLILVEELIQPELDNTLRREIISNLFSEWLKQQVETFEVEIDLRANSVQALNSESRLLVASS
ncbi:MULTISPECIES: peptidylprolyl isomerase [Chroococcidiopsis]|uniref:peptidylprolyl isomerase n=1 Tax=Chroococcidiopsis thermalis (strain PCC 7203) TaxID=251229 RepID=K9U259_CHRTP|nr:MULTISPECIES: peptidylprolyl isomerase [Chroococcidiopsis]AFY89187.1 PpiC-type peptidyl-prolyl cis-trans isomerase [Chroococcidiopsis thermalis PCC 7203]PSB42795.1 peptidylprolyl isomerase [Cyanosarcina cf. burmensis CCALA 770]URD48497.1 peptidylprolyl isomerase [Chroococcidiopsis sp. CCNUC1]